MAAGRVDDGEAAMAQGQSWMEEEALAIRTAMADRIRHVLDA